jgi:hypothetical protein
MSQLKGYPLGYYDRDKKVCYVRFPDGNIVTIPDSERIPAGIHSYVQLFAYAKEKYDARIRVSSLPTKSIIKNVFRKEV